MTDEIDPKDHLLAINEAFYAAFASGDLAWMTDIWSARREITCIHPGHGASQGRTEVLSGWFDILQQPPGISFADAVAFLHGDTGIVLCRERIGPHSLAATNVFRLEGQRWRMVHHQAGAIHAPAETPGAGEEGPGQLH
jgi:hypothetical protein